MAHECPECGQTCYCNGDIDDCCFLSEYYYIHCDHYKECQLEDDAYDECYECSDKKIVCPSPMRGK